MHYLGFAKSSLPTCFQQGTRLPSFIDANTPSQLLVEAFSNIENHLGNYEYLLYSTVLTKGEQLGVHVSQNEASWELTLVSEGAGPTIKANLTKTGVVCRQTPNRQILIPGVDTVAGFDTLHHLAQTFDDLFPYAYRKIACSVLHLTQLVAISSQDQWLNLIQSQRVGLFVEPGPNKVLLDVRSLDLLALAPTQLLPVLLAGPGYDLNYSTKELVNIFQAAVV